jgi:AbrB family looped-hinge helix DNA binding protein
MPESACGLRRSAQQPLRTSLMVEGPLRSLPDQVMRHGMTHKVGPKGQVVIPKDLRDVLGIEPGDEVTFWRDGDHVAVRPVRSTPQLRGRFAGSALVDELHRERTADRAREDRR